MTVAAVTGMSLPFRADLDTVDILVFYLIAITGIALFADLHASIIAAAAAFLAFNYFFTIPYHTFFVTNTHDILALIAFLGISILISRLVVRTRTRTREALRRGRQTETLHQLSIELIRAGSLDAVLESIVKGVHQIIEPGACAVLLYRDDGLQVGASTAGPPDIAGSDVLLAAQSSFARGKPTDLVTTAAQSQPEGPERNSSLPPSNEVEFFPIATVDETIGVLAVAREYDQRPIDAEGRRLLMTFANQAALAIERSLLTEERTRAEVLSRTDELKTALLSAVSHDLRTPLASIKASITTLMQPGIEWSETDRRDLEEAIDEEADRLNRLVANLLDLSRIDAGALKPTLDWYQASEIVYEVIERCDAMLANHRVVVELPAQIIWINIDFVMISEVLTNLLENATKYSPSGSRIRLSARIRGDMLELQVNDEGMGVPQGEEERIFDKFYRVEAKYRPVGSGMGLAICRGFVEAHGGRIWVESNLTGGSTFAFTVPLAGIDQELFQAPEYEAALS